MAQIILVFQDKVVEKYMITEGGVLTIGRHPKNKIVLDNLSVSGRHAKISQGKDGLILQDLGSTNGTFVNNEKVSKTWLVHQDLVGVGNYQLIVDMYESLSLESTMDVLLSGNLKGAHSGDQTVMYDMSTGLTTGRLIFLAGGEGEFKLMPNLTTIGKNKDADIIIRGFWSFLAGQPAARIERQGNNFVLSYSGGRMRPKVNHTTVSNTMILNDLDEIKIGPLRMRIEIG